MYQQKVDKCDASNVVRSIYLPIAWHRVATKWSDILIVVILLDVSDAFLLLLLSAERLCARAMRHLLDFVLGDRYHISAQQKPSRTLVHSYCFNKRCFLQHNNQHEFIGRSSY